MVAVVQTPVILPETDLGNVLPVMLPDTDDGWRGDLIAMVVRLSPALLLLLHAELEDRWLREDPDLSWLLSLWDAMLAVFEALGPDTRRRILPLFFLLLLFQYTVHNLKQYIRKRS